MSPSFINELAQAEMGKGNGMVVVHSYSSGKLVHLVTGHWRLYVNVGSGHVETEPAYQDSGKFQPAPLCWLPESQEYVQ